MPPWKWVGPFIWTNLNPLHPRLLCVKFGWNWPSGSGEEDFLILSTYFRYFVIISPWKRTGPFIWTNLNPLHPSMLCAKFGWNGPSGSGEEDFFISSTYFYYCVIISTWKMAGPLIWINLNPLHPRMPCAKSQWFWRRRGKCEKFTDGRRDRWTDNNETTDNRWSEKLTWAFSSGELKTCVSRKTAP